MVDWKEASRGILIGGRYRGMFGLEGRAIAIFGLDGVAVYGFGGGSNAVLGLEGGRISRYDRIGRVRRHMF